MEKNNDLITLGKMKMINKVLLCILFLCTMSACTQATKTQLDMETYQALLEEKESFVLVVSSEAYTTSSVFQRTLQPFLKDNETLPIYEIKLDQIGDKKLDEEINLNEIRKVSDGYNGSVPAVLYYQEGVVKDIASGALSEQEFSNFLIKNDVIKGEIKEIKYDYTLATSDFLPRLTTQEVEEKLQAEEDFYVVVVDYDRYNALFTNTLKKVAEERDMIIYCVDEVEAQILLDAKMTPSLFQVKEGNVVDSLMDNASEEELIKWIEQ